jgi:hypothetical protein
VLAVRRFFFLSLPSLYDKFMVRAIITVSGKHFFQLDDHIIHDINLRLVSYHGRVVRLFIIRDYFRALR